MSGSELAGGGATLLPTIIGPPFLIGGVFSECKSYFYVSSLYQFAMCCFRSLS